MSPRFVTRDPFWVLGLQRTASPFQMDYESFWAEFARYADQLAPLASAPGNYGVYFPTGVEELDIFAGVAVPADVEVPEGLVLREVAGGDFAVFESNIAELADTWVKIYQKWAPSSSRAADHHRPAYEWFSPEAMEGQRPVLIHVPLDPLAAQD